MVNGFELFSPAESCNQVSRDNTIGRPVLQGRQSRFLDFQHCLFDSNASDTLKQDFYGGSLKKFWEVVFIQSLLHRVERLPDVRGGALGKSHS